ncbi:OpgC domain-containing protein [Sinirhodobacter populi]|uniref:OpgC domain-containing protein n=1 Tax=Paenirhodobacter populi TaxID=2306993 RepID=A0A443KJR0_9RHOB|nr:OpgC domain-containing protein [Sinirhodobacter populi]RWR33021.1 OpgC domain-containing protein [Sinirhodobacter populi]
MTGTTPTTHPGIQGLAPGQRDPRLDFFRGLSLIMIFMNHVPGTFFENLTSRNFGLSDAAEGFVFMSGCAVALAYGPKMKDGLNLDAVRKGWGRAWQLYLVHMMTTVWAMALVAGGVLWLGADEVLLNNSFIMMWKQPVEVILGVATLGHQFGYVNILPMYAVLMLGAPFLVRLGQRNPMALLALSVGFWILTFALSLDLPNYPQPGGWFFNPFAWQLIFTLGILTGLALREGRRFVPVKPWLVWIAAIWLVFCFAWVQDVDLKEWMNQTLNALRAQGVPGLVAGFDKTFVSMPRLTHFIALAYILSMPLGIPKFAASQAMEPVRLIGRHSLPVFATGTVIAIFAQVVKDVHPAGIEQDMLLVLGGLFAQWCLAYALEWSRQRDGRTKPPVVREAEPEVAPHRLPVAPSTSLR